MDSGVVLAYLARFDGAAGDSRSSSSSKFQEDGMPMSDDAGSPGYGHDRCGHARHVGGGGRSDPSEEVSKQDEQPQGWAYRSEHIRRLRIPSALPPGC